MKEFITKNTKETEKLATILAEELTSRASENHGLIIGLEGELGAGKTTFAQAFAKALGVKDKILSPTFVLIKSYKLQAISSKPKAYNLKPIAFSFLHHIDAYRLKDHQDLASLGIKEIFEDSQNIVLIEWSDRVEKILPKDYIKIHIDHISENERKITIK